MSPRKAALAGVAALLFAVLLAGALGSTGRQGGNLVRPLAPIAGLTAGTTVCQAQEHVPAGTGRVRFDAAGATAVTVRVESPGAAPARGHVAAGWGELVVPLAGAGERRDARVCVTNDGPQDLTLAGEAFGPELAARVGEAPLPGRIRIVYLRPRDESWLAAAPDVAGRVAAVRGAAPGAATAYSWAALALAVGIGAVVLVVRSPADD